MGANSNLQPLRWVFYSVEVWRQTWPLLDLSLLLLEPVFCLLENIWLEEPFMIHLDRFGGFSADVLQYMALFNGPTFCGEMHFVSHCRYTVPKTR